MFLKEKTSCTHEGYFYLIKNTVKQQYVKLLQFKITNNYY